MPVIGPYTQFGGCKSVVINGGDTYDIGRDATLLLAPGAGSGTASIRLPLPNSLAPGHVIRIIWASMGSFSFQILTYSGGVQTLFDVNGQPKTLITNDALSWSVQPALECTMLSPNVPLGGGTWTARLWGLTYL